MANKQGGFIGLLVLLIGVAFIVFFLVRTDLFTGGKKIIDTGDDSWASDKSILENSVNVVDSAKALKAKLEENSQPVSE